MRAGAGRFALLKLAHQLLHLLVGERLPSLDCGALAYGCDEAFLGLRSQRIVSLSQELKNVHKCRTDVWYDQYGWYSADKMARSTEWFHSEPRVVQEGQVLAKLTGQRGIEIQVKRLQQCLRGDGMLLVFSHHLLVENPLVSSMLVDEIHTLWPFGNYVGLADLPDDA